MNVRETDGPLVLIIARPISTAVIATHISREGVRTLRYKVTTDTSPPKVVDRLLTLLGDETPFLAFLEMNVMQPGWDGISLLKEIRSRQRFSSMKVILVGKPNVLSMVRAKLAGADDYLFLPYTREEVLALFNRQKQV